MNVSAPFIRRPVATSLLAAALLVAGAAAFTQLPVAPLPRVDFPTIGVGAGLPGASPETMASAVATPLERRFGRIAGLVEMTSTSSLGSTGINLQFDLDRDVESAARDVQAAINAAAGELPGNLPFRPTYRKVNTADNPILIISLKSKTLPLAQVFDAANTILAQKISQVQGVGQVTVGGGQQPAVRVQVDPGALAGVGLGLEDVRRALGTLTANQPKGSVSDGAQTQAIAANDQLMNADAWRQTIIHWYRPGQDTSAGASAGPGRTDTAAPVRLGDVARVSDSVENDRAAAWESGERTVIVVIRRQPGANILEVIERVKAILPGLTRAISPAIDVTVALDRAQTIRASVAEVEVSLVLSVALVVLVVFAFLRSFRATVIPSVAVPISLVATFGVMYLLGYSINNLSLMALTISTGFVVDDAIVVTENVSRLIERGEDPLRAAFDGARQIGFTIVSITVSLLAVFIPILLMGGIVGRLFREFAVTLAVAITVSAVISLTLTPTMCARLLRSEHGQAHGAHSARSARSAWDRLLERGFEALQQGYGRALRLILRHRTALGLVTLGTIALTLYLYVIVPKGLFPQQDTGLLIGFSDAPQDISFPALKARQEALNDIIKTDPDVDHFVSFIGTGNTGSMFISLKPRPGRKATADEIINRLRPRLGRVQGISLFLQAAQDVRIGGRLARTQYQYTLQDANLEELRQWAPKMLAKLRTLPELRDVASDQQTAGLQLMITIDRDTAARLGVNMRTLDDTLYDAFGQRQVATTFTQLNQYRVVLEIKPELALGPEALSQIYVRSATGAQVPLSALAQVGPSSTLLSVSHQGQFPSVTLSFNAAPGVALSQAVDAIHRAEREIGLPAAVHATFQGTAQAFRDSLDSEPWLILAALVTVYIVLGMLYESFIHPITILSTLPSAGVGALLALLLCRVELNVIALIGIILLIGIVKKNAIMMIDFAIEAERDEGLAPEEAIYQACILRFRPILMTTMAALLGALPLALGGGIGSELRRPLGIAIIGGLLFSQLLTLFTTPVTYLALDRFVRRRPKSEARAESMALSSQ
ncbi:MAG TPA: multidrug efflux RND transporter permease subunit [Polyangia bacterium]|nr:multidrug efflux RND transporter permease subunit [Polyangia bacterium]